MSEASKTRVPWADLDGPIYEADERETPRKPWVKQACWIMCAFLIVGGIMTKFYFVIIFAVLYILVLLRDKHIAVTERGLEIWQNMRLADHYDIWKWSEIDAVVREDKHKKNVALWFSRGDRTKRLFFDRHDAQAIMDMARSNEYRIKVAESTEKKQRPEDPKTKGKRKDHVRR